MVMRPIFFILYKSMGGDSVKIHDYCHRKGGLGVIGRWFFERLRTRAWSVVLSILVSTTALCQNASEKGGPPQPLSNSGATLRVDSLNRLGRYWTDRDPEKAKSILKQSIALSDSIHYDWGSAMACRALGSIYDFQGYIFIASHYFEKAVKLLEAHHEDKFRAEVLYIRAIPAGRTILVPLTKKIVIPWDSTVKMLREAARMKIDLNDHVGAGEVLERLGHEHTLQAYAKNDTTYYATAHDYYLKSRDEYARANYEDGIATAPGKIAILYHVRGKIAQALNFYWTAYRECRKTGNIMFMSRNLVNIAEAIWEQKKSDSAIACLNEAIAIAKKLDYLPVIYRGGNMLADIYKAKGDYKKVSEIYFELYKRRDLHFGEENMATITELQAQYENKIKTAELSRLKLENQLKSDALRTRYLIIIFLMLLVVVVALGSYIIIRNRKRYLAKISTVEVQQRMKGEKERLAKDLHDNIGAQLTSLVLGLHQLERKDNLNHTAAIFLEEEINAVRSELRDTIWAINKEEITLEEFTDKVRNLFWRYQQQVGDMRFEVTHSIAGTPKRLTPLQGVNLLRILQEATTNSLRHSGGSELKVTLASTAGGLSIQIRDNGKGFNPAAHAADGDHYGIQNMKRRAEEIGAVLVIEADHGATVTVKVPL